MAKQVAFIADVAIARNLMDMKRLALLFDSVKIIRTPESMADRAAGRGVIYDDLERESEYLTRMNFVSQARDPSEDLAFGRELPVSDDPGLTPVLWLRELGFMPTHDSSGPDLTKQDSGKFGQYRRALTGNIALSSYDREDVFYRSLADFVARYAAAIQAEDDQDAKIPITFGREYDLKRLGADILDPFVREDDSYGVGTVSLLSKVYLTDERTPWESIFEFRSDQENRAAFLNLKRYLRGLARESSTLNEIQDEIDYNLYTTESALKRAKVKYTTATLESSVVAGVSIIENLLKLKLTEIAKNMFAVSRAHNDFLETEAKIAEHGLYYIVKANKSLGA